MAALNCCRVLAECFNVRLRNPWGQHPAPDGVFTIPLSEFALAFPALTIEDPAQP
ncbi:MAG: hypothetical protein ACRD01_03910 [Terriglobales bacterium]